MAVVVKVVEAALADGLVLLALAGCGGGPSEKDCKAALEQQWHQAVAGTGQQGTEPDACKGLPAATVQRLWAEAGESAQ